jgi:hypothetical protein
MRLFTMNFMVSMQKPLPVFLLLFVALLECLLQRCEAKSLDGISLQFNKRGEILKRGEKSEEKKCKSFVILYVGAKDANMHKIVTREKIIEGR